MYNYTLDVLKHNLSITKEFNESIFDRMENESEYIMKILENYQLVTEADQSINNTNQQTSIFEKISEFFKRLFGIFSEKTKAVFDSNKQWMNDNFNKLDKIDYTKLKIQMIPFWNMTLNRLKTDSANIQKTMEKIMSNKNSLEKYRDLNTIKKDIYGEYLDNNGDLTNGLKNYYRTGNAKESNTTIALEGATLKDKINEFKTYCFNYNKDIVPFVKALMDSSQKEIQQIEKVIRSRPISENFCLVENALYVNTDIAQISGFILLEADQQKPDDTKTKPTDVKLVNKADDTQNKDDEANTKYNGMSTNTLIFLKNNMQISQLSVSALMTVLEERFRAYMNALRVIINESKQTANNNPDEKNVKKTMGEK